MSLLQDTIDLSKLYDVKPTKNRGQNFLIEENIYKKIIEVANLQNTETVLEVGPGLGFLTLALAKEAKKVVAVELDKKLFAALTNRLALADIKNVCLFNEDIMNFSLSWVKEIKKISNDDLVVVANLPYTITSIFLRHFVGGNNFNILPTRFVLMLQKEVAERICAPKGKLSVLALSIQLFTQPKIEKVISKKSFWPSPQVDSAIISLTRDSYWLDRLAKQQGNTHDLLRLIKIGFSARRKMLKANLANGYKMPVDKILKQFSLLGLDPNSRAQELGLEEWLKLLPLFS